MSHDPNYNTLSESTTDRAEHPVKEFLKTAGVDTSSFPRVRFLLELNPRTLVNAQVYIPLRLPGRSGIIFESFARVVRMMEIPSTRDGQSHRRFVEVEWLIDESPVLESENHPVFNFLNGDIECPRCKTSFVPESEILDEVSVEIPCPSCTYRWIVQIQTHSQEHPLKLITDEFYKQPAGVRRFIEARQTQIYTPETKEKEASLFAVNFESLGDEEALNLFFENQTGFRCLLQDEQVDFELIFKSFFNRIALDFFILNSDKRGGNNLESTEIFRKSKISAKEEAASSIEAKKEIQEDKPLKEEKKNPFQLKTQASFYPREQQQHLSKAVGLSALAILLLGGTALGGYHIYNAVFTPEHSEKNQAILLENKQKQTEEQFIDQPARAALLDSALSELKTENSTTAKSPELKKQEKAPPVKTAPKKNPKPKPKPKPKQSPGARAESHFQKGLAFLRAEQFESAVGEFNDALAADKDHLGSHRLLGKAHLHLGEIDKALTSFQTFLKIPSEKKLKKHILEVNNVVQKLEQLKLATSSQ